MQTRHRPPTQTLRLLILSLTTTATIAALSAIFLTDGADPSPVAPLSVQRDEVLYERCREEQQAPCALELQRLNDARADYALTVLESREHDPHYMHVLEQGGSHSELGL